MARIRVAVVGIGNCASSLVQGVEFYRRASGHSPIPGVMHLELGGYHIGDIEFVAAFDIAIIPPTIHSRQGQKPLISLSSEITARPHSRCSRGSAFVARINSN